MSDLEIEKVYGRGRKKHVAFDYATHLHVSTEYNLELRKLIALRNSNTDLMVSVTLHKKEEKIRN